MQFFVQGRDLLVEVLRREVVQSVGRVGVAESDHEGPVEVGLAEDFKLVCKLVSLEVGSVRLLIQNVEAYKHELISSDVYPILRWSWRRGRRFSA